MKLTAPWPIVHLDLDEPLPTLSAPDGTGGLFVVIWQRSIPLGKAIFLREQLPVRPESLAAIVAGLVAPAVGARLDPDLFPPRHPVLDRFVVPPPAPDLQRLSRLDDVLPRHAAASAMPAADGRSVSVVICTRNRPEALVRCLDSLASQIDEILEIVVVDNAPEFPQTAAAIAGRPKVRYVAEPRPGLSIARNSGMRVSTGDIIAFTDDDVVVHPHWVRRLRAAFDRPDILCVTGLVLPLNLATDAQLYFEVARGGFGQGFATLLFRESLFQTYRTVGPPVWQIGAGANMALLRPALGRVGGFDERLGAGAAGCSEDSEFWYRVLSAGYDCRYDPAAVVFHEHRPDDAGLQRQMFAYMKGHVAALLVQYHRHGNRGDLFRLLVVLPAHYVRALLAMLKPGRKGYRRYALREAAGFLAGFGALWWYRRSDPAAQPWTTEET